MDLENMEAEQAQETAVEQEDKKVFTQDEVNDIVQARLERERKRLNAMINEDEAIKQELTESRLKLEAAKELRDKDYPQELLELFDYSDASTYEQSKERVLDVFNRALNSKVDQIFRANGRTPHTNTGSFPGKDPLKAAFLKR